MSEEAAEVERPQVFNRQYRYPWDDGWAVRLPSQFDTPFPTHAEAIAHADDWARNQPEKP